MKKRILILQLPTLSIVGCHGAELLKRLGCHVVRKNTRRTEDGSEGLLCTASMADRRDDKKDLNRWQDAEWQPGSSGWSVCEQGPSGSPTSQHSLNEGQSRLLFVDFIAMTHFLSEVQGWIMWLKIYLYIICTDIAIATWFTISESDHFREYFQQILLLLCLQNFLFVGHGISKKKKYTHILDFDIALGHVAILLTFALIVLPSHSVTHHCWVKPSSEGLPGSQTCHNEYITFYPSVNQTHLGCLSAQDENKTNAQKHKSSESEFSTNTLRRVNNNVRQMAGKAREGLSVRAIASSKGRACFCCLWTGWTIAFYCRIWHYVIWLHREPHHTNHQYKWWQEGRVYMKEAFNFTVLNIGHFGIGYGSLNWYWWLWWNIEMTVRLSSWITDEIVQNYVERSFDRV